MRNFLGLSIVPYIQSFECGESLSALKNAVNDNHLVTDTSEITHVMWVLLGEL